MPILFSGILQKMEPQLLNQKETFTPSQLQEVYKTKKYYLFCMGLSIAVLFDIASNKGFGAGLHLSLLSLGAIFLFVKPSSFFRLLVFLMLLIY